RRREHHAYVRATRSLSAGVKAWLLVYPSALSLRNAPASVFHQRHIGWVLRSSCNSRGRRVALSRGREPRPGRCPPLWPSELRNDGGRLAVTGVDGGDA